jgi:hypothetical protein
VRRRIGEFDFATLSPVRRFPGSPFRRCPPHSRSTGPPDDPHRWKCLYFKGFLSADPLERPFSNGPPDTAKRRNGEPAKRRVRSLRFAVSPFRHVLIDAGGRGDGPLRQMAGRVVKVAKTPIFIGSCACRPSPPSPFSDGGEGRGAISIWRQCDLTRRLWAKMASVEA